MIEFNEKEKKLILQLLATVQIFPMDPKTGAINEDAVETTETLQSIARKIGGDDLPGVQ